MYDYIINTKLDNFYLYSIDLIYNLYFFAILYIDTYYGSFKKIV